MRRIPNHLFLLVAALVGVASSGCQSGGVGDPCIPEDEYRSNFSGYSVTEVNVESRSFQCETRVCLVANFNGRVSCPYGQPGVTGQKDPALANTVDPSYPASQRCYLPGATAEAKNQVVVPVPQQKTARQPDKAVYCSCRCDGPDKTVNYCQCPSGYACEKLVTDYGIGSAQLAGSYCIKDGTSFNPATAGSDCRRPTGAATTGECGKVHPEGI